MFTPHAFKTVAHGVPSVFVTETAIRKMWVITSMFPKEIGWLTTVTMDEAGDLTIHDVYLVKHKLATSATCELDGQDIGRLMNDLMREDMINEVDPMSAEWRGDKLVGWFHSHHTMGTSPSGQDNSQFDEFMAGGADWFLRGIVNKQGQMTLDVKYKCGLKVTDLSWQILWEHPQEMLDQIEAQIKEYVPPSVQTSYTPTKYSGKGYNPPAYKGTQPINGAAPNKPATPPISQPANQPSTPPVGKTVGEYLRESVEQGLPPVGKPKDDQTVMLGVLGDKEGAK